MDTAGTHPPTVMSSGKPTTKIVLMSSARLLKLLLRETWLRGNGGGGMNTELNCGWPSDSGDPLNSEGLLRCVGLKGSTDAERWDLVGLVCLLLELLTEVNSEL